MSCVVGLIHIPPFKMDDALELHEPADVDVTMDQSNSVSVFFLTILLNIRRALSIAVSKFRYSGLRRVLFVYCLCFFTMLASFVARFKSFVVYFLVAYKISLRWFGFNNSCLRGRCLAWLASYTFTSNSYRSNSIQVVLAVLCRLKGYHLLQHHTHEHNM